MSKKASLIPTDTPSINSNLERLNNQFANTLSLDGSTPNALSADLDLNSNDILNAKEINADKVVVNGVSLVDATTTDRFNTVSELKSNTNSYPDGTRFSIGGLNYKAVDTGGQIVSAGGQRFEITDAEWSPLHFGGVPTWDVADLTANTAIVQEMMDAVGTHGAVFTIPRGFWYDVHSLTAAFYTTIIDGSGFDYRAKSGGAEQATIRIFHKTTDTHGTSNENTFWNIGDYHPAFVANSLATVGTGGAKASFISWVGTPTKPTTYAAQWTLDMNDAARPKIGVAAYDQSPSGIGSSYVFTHGHVADEENAYGFGNYDFPNGNSYSFYQSGLASAANYLTKDYVGLRQMPAGGTGAFDEYWKRGSTQIYRRYMDEAGAFDYHLGNSVESIGGFKQWGAGGELLWFDGALYGAKVLTKEVTNADGLMGTVQNGSIQHNSLFTGTIWKYLPAATPGRNFKVFITVNQMFEIYPALGEKFIGKAVNKYMKSDEIGAWVEFNCIASGVWFFQRGGTWTDEP